MDWWWDVLIDTMQVGQGIFAGVVLVIVVDNVLWVEVRFSDTFSDWNQWLT